MTTHPQACQPDPRLCGTKFDEQSSPSREEIEKLLPKNFALTAGAMSKKLVFERHAKTVLSDSQDFAHKLLCTGPTLNLGDACVYSCQYCYVSAMMWRLLAPLLKAVNLSHRDIVVRRGNSLQVLENQLRTHAGILRESERRKKHVVFTSTTVDPAGNMELVKESAELMCRILEETNWDIRVLSKSNLLPQLAKLIPDKWKHRVIYGVSSGTLDDDLARAIEAGTALVSKRLQSLHWLQDNGYRTFGMICPALPQTNYDEFAEKICNAIRVEKCEDVWAEGINARGKSFPATLQALQTAGKMSEASLLCTVALPGTQRAEEEYKRQLFLALAGRIPATKFKFLQYVESPEDHTWWKDQQKNGAVLLGSLVHSKPKKQKNQQESVPPQEAAPPELTAAQHAAKKAWVTKRAKYSAAEISARSKAAAFKAWETRRRNQQMSS